MTDTDPPRPSWPGGGEHQAYGLGAPTAEFCDCCEQPLNSDDPVLCAYCVGHCLDEEVAE